MYQLLYLNYILSKHLSIVSHIEDTGSFRPLNGLEKYKL